jgi:hypothetical protein
MLKNITGALVVCKEALVKFIFKETPGGINKWVPGNILLPAKSFKPVKSAGAIVPAPPFEPEANTKSPTIEPVTD